MAIDLPSTPVYALDQIPPSIQLAVPVFHQPNHVDLILEVEISVELFNVTGRIQLGNGLPTLVNSVFGWVVSGETTQPSITTPIICNIATVSDINNLMEKFWSIEEDSVRSCYSVEEIACEEHFRRTFSRNPDGRYIVRLPVKEEVIVNLVDNRRTAIRRFRLLQTQLARNEELNQHYCDFMNEYLTSGHMQRVEENQSSPRPCYYLPHHAVVKEDSTTTRVRVVFDASCPTPNGPSLNDALMVGPIVQENLRSIIMRSRIRPVLLNADIKQMYRQILTDHQSNNLQHIVWSPSHEVPLYTYELKTVTYGTASAPFLATRVLQQLAEDEQDNFPDAAHVLRKDFYVDDLYSGANTIEEAVALRKQLEALLQKGGFELRKWISNESAVVQDVAPEKKAVQSTIDLERDLSVKTLGLHWVPNTDMLRPLVPLNDDPSDFEALTPGHFLTGSALKAVPDYDYSSTPFNRLRQWQQTQKIFHDIWKRWHSEYLATLQPRTKWLKAAADIEIGRLVIIKDENSPPLRWEMGRIVEVHAGADNIVRVVTL
ncbi:uncharacterized protein LOC134209533 [Armigeres subalbatus]|uniref:uncharacterized protein LOC134209533 n=1 Tax=Armigeres subalbatus TaxID=124917 RepID=UPI002ED24957